MSEFKKILCPTDFSDNADHALAYARAFAEKSGGTVDVVHSVDVAHNQFAPIEGVYVSSADVHRSLQMLKDHAQEKMDHLVKKEHALGLEVTPHMRTGFAAEEVVKVAEELDCDLIVAATHGRSALGHMLFGSTCDKILRLAHTPVLAVKSHEREFVSKDGKSIRLSKILCPIDFSDFSRTALPKAKELARQFGASIVLAHVVDARLDYPEWTAQATVNNSGELAKSAEEALNAIAESIQGIDTEVKVIVGIAHTTLVNMVADNEVELVVLPSHGRKGFAHAMLGSTAEKLVRLAPSPVLVVRPQE